jgi:hypothetical protein
MRARWAIEPALRELRYRLTSEWHGKGDFGPHMYPLATFLTKSVLGGGPVWNAHGEQLTWKLQPANRSILQARIGCLILEFVYFAGKVGRYDEV